MNETADATDLRSESNELLSNSQQTAYVWAECLSAGWEVLISESELTNGIAEPPECALLVSQHTNSRTPQPKPRAKSVISIFRDPADDTSQPLFEESVRDPPTPTSAVVLKESPSPKNFVILNKQTKSPTGYQTKAKLLDQATQQIRSSEKIGASLAERLRIIQKKLEYGE